MASKNSPSPILYPYQRKWLMDRSQFKIGMFARQSGKTFTSTLEIALDMVKAELAGKATRWVILSRGERQAKEAMTEGVKRHLMAMKFIFDLRESTFAIGSGLGIRALEATMPHGSRVTALPANPDTARGYSANVLLDEFAFHHDSNEIWKALFPVISKPGLKLRVVSTPNGKNNKFYELMTKYPTWSKHVVDIYQAVEDGLPRDIAKLREGAGDEELWAQEYELQWLDESSAWLSYELISSCENEFAGDPSAYMGNPCYVGCDIGRRRDLFVIWVVEDIDGIAITREIIARRNASFAEQDELLDSVFRRYDVRRLCMDQSGMGEKPVEDAIRRYGQDRVEGILFNTANHLALANCGRAAFEQRRILIPQNDHKLRDDLHKLERKMSPTGNPRFVADSDAAGHADRAWACFMALMAMEKPKMEYAYQPVKDDPTPDMYRDLLFDDDFRGFGPGAW